MEPSNHAADGPVGLAGPPALHAGGRRFEPHTAHLTKALLTQGFRLLAEGVVQHGGGGDWLTCANQAHSQIVSYALRSRKASAPLSAHAPPLLGLALVVAVVSSLAALEAGHYASVRESLRERRA